MWTADKSACGVGENRVHVFTHAMPCSTSFCGNTGRGLQRVKSMRQLVGAIRYEEATVGFVASLHCRV